MIILGLRANLGDIEVKSWDFGAKFSNLVKFWGTWQIGWIRGKILGFGVKSWDLG